MVVGSLSLRSHPHKTDPSVRSFVCRNTKLSPSKLALWEALWPLYGVEGWQQSPTLAPQALFSQNNPLILEIGFGTGGSLFEMAKNQPDQNFMGIEVYRLGIAQLLARLKAHPLPNLKLFLGDAIQLVEHLALASLSRIHIFFPDPWPKLKHRKRRLIKPSFAALLASRLKVEGILHLASDWEDYAKHMMQVLSQEPLLQNTALGQAYAERPDYRPLTKYERRGMRLQHLTRDLIFIKKPS